jgi:hypothetical protein
LIGRALDSNNDIFLAKGSFAVVTEAAQTIQHVRTRLLFYLEEWKFDLSAGTPWFQEVFIKPANMAEIETIIKSRILNTPDVLQLNSFAMAFDARTRQLDVVFSAETTFGVIDNEKVFLNV